MSCKRCFHGPLDDLVNQGQNLVDDTTRKAEEQVTSGILTAVVVGLGFAAVLLLLRDRK